MPAEYWRAYRQRNRERLLAQQNERRRKCRVRGDRTEEYRKRAIQRQRRKEPLPILFPHLVRGTEYSFWEDELRMDCEQERLLAMFLGQDPEQAVAAYRKKEYEWNRTTVTYQLEDEEAA